MKMNAESLSTDSWSWRKYGQKPIQGSITPRFVSEFLNFTFHQNFRHISNSFHFEKQKLLSLQQLQRLCS